MDEPTTPTSSQETETPATPTPFLKWAGGKRQLLSDLAMHLPQRMDWYIEPFVGGGALFFDRAYHIDHAVIGDANGELVLTYAAVSREVEAVIAHLSTYRNDPVQFYETRDKVDPKSLDHAARAARFIYLNRICFNGLYRENRAGRFNVPFGRYTNPTICNAPVLRAASKALARCDSIVEGDFERVVQVALGRRFIDQPGLVGATIYCDPPYVSISKTSNFVAYQGKGFGPQDQKRLRDAALRWLDQGASVVLSNHDVPEVRELYGDPERFVIHKVDARRNINSKAEKRGAVGEVIIVGKKGGS